jgi:hypothetical protein
MHSQAIVDILKILPYMTTSSIFWHIARVLTSTGLLWQGSSLIYFLPHLNCLDQYFTWYSEGAASPYTASIHS